MDTLFLGQWLNFKLFGITYLVGKIKFKLFFFQGPLAEWALVNFLWRFHWDSAILISLLSFRGTGSRPKCDQFSLMSRLVAMASFFTLRYMQIIYPQYLHLTKNILSAISQGASYFFYLYAIFADGNRWTTKTPSLRFNETRCALDLHGFMSPILIAWVVWHEVYVMLGSKTFLVGGFKYFF